MQDSPGPLRAKGAYDVLTLRASAATAVGAISGTTGSAVYLPRPENGITFILDVTAAATDVGDTLDITIQTIIDGTNWVDVCAFTQVLGNGGAKRHIGKISTATAQAMYEVATALTAGNIRHIFGDAWRVKTTQVDADSDASFTFAVLAVVC